MPLSTTAPTFCLSPFLGKRPRRTHSFAPTTAQRLPCTRATPLRCTLTPTPSDPNFPPQVEEAPDDTDHDHDHDHDQLPRPPTVLPVALDLLNYHARTSARRPHTHDVAIRLYRRCLSLNPSDGRAWLGLARLQARAGDPAAARTTFETALRICPRNAHLLQAWGVLEERQQNHTRAKQLYLSALRADASHAPAWVALGLWQQHHAHDSSSARDAFRRGAHAAPRNYYVWHVWGVLEKSCRRYAAARDCFRKGVEANPYNAATYVLWGSLEDEVGNSTLAMTLFEKAHAVSPRNTHAYLSHSVAAEKAGDSTKALRLLRAAIDIRPRDAAPRQALGLLLFRTGDLAAARDAFAKALENDVRHPPTWHAWARCEWAAGNHKKARKLFQEAVWAAPRSSHVVRTWHSWATMEMDLGCFETARRYFAHGLDVNNRSVVLLTGLALLDAKEGHLSRARECMERCVKLEPWRQSMWRFYQQLETEYGSAHRSQLVYERSVVVGQQVEERFNLSKPLPGDFQGSGMWIDALELPPDKSAFDSVGAGKPAPRPRRRGRREEQVHVEWTSRESSGSWKQAPRRGNVSRSGGKRYDDSGSSNTGRDDPPDSPTSMRTAYGY